MKLNFAIEFVADTARPPAQPEAFYRITSAPPANVSLVFLYVCPEFFGSSWGMFP
jgi:hypothetical protein